MLILLVSTSCGTTSIDPASIEAKLVNRISSTCIDSTNCTVRLKDVTNFDWDRVYIFDYTVSQAEIEKVIGVPFLLYEEFTRSMIFLDGGKLVYGEANPTDVEGLINNEVVFDTADQDVYKSYSPESQFEVKRKNFQRGVYYELSPVIPINREQ